MIHIYLISIILNTINIALIKIYLQLRKYFNYNSILCNDKYK